MAFAYRVIDGVSILSFVHSFVTWVFVYEWELFSRFLSLSLPFLFSLRSVYFFKTFSSFHLLLTLARSHAHSPSVCILIIVLFTILSRHLLPIRIQTINSSILRKSRRKTWKWILVFVLYRCLFHFFFVHALYPPPPSSLSSILIRKEMTRAQNETNWVNVRVKEKCLAHCRR